MRKAFEQDLGRSGTVQGKQSTRVHMRPYRSPITRMIPCTLLPVFIVGASGLVMNHHVFRLALGRQTIYVEFWTFFVVRLWPVLPKDIFDISRHEHQWHLY